MNITPHNSHFPVLPNKIWSSIFNELDINSCYEFAKVSKEFQRIGNGSTYWKRFLKSPKDKADYEGQEKTIFRTDLTARNSKGLKLDRAGLLYSELKLLKGNPEILNEKIDGLIDNLIIDYLRGDLKNDLMVNLKKDDLKDSITRVGLKNNVMKYDSEMLKIILNYKEINEIFSVVQLCTIAFLYKEAALNMLNRENIIQRIDGDNLATIALRYKEVALVVLGRKELSKNLNVDHIIKIAEYHKDNKEIIIIILTLKELYTRLKEEHFKTIAREYKISDKSDEEIIQTLRRNIIPPVIPGDYKSSVNTAIIKKG